MAIMITYEDGVSDEEARLFEEAVSQARTRVREIKADLEKTWFAVAGELQLPPTEPPWPMTRWPFNSSLYHPAP